jgi:hypothetical protein
MTRSNTVSFVGPLSHGRRGGKVRAGRGLEASTVFDVHAVFFRSIDLRLVTAFALLCVSLVLASPAAAQPADRPWFIVNDPDATDAERNWRPAPPEPDDNWHRPSNPDDKRAPLGLGQLYISETEHHRGVVPALVDRWTSRAHPRGGSGALEEGARIYIEVLEDVEVSPGSAFDIIVSATGIFMPEEDPLPKHLLDRNQRDHWRLSVREDGHVLRVVKR